MKRRLRSGRCCHGSSGWCTASRVTWSHAALRRTVGAQSQKTPRRFSSTSSLRLVMWVDVPMSSHFCNQVVQTNQIKHYVMMGQQQGALRQLWLEKTLVSPCVKLWRMILGKCEHIWKAPSHITNTTFKTSLRSKIQRQAVFCMIFFKADISVRIPLLLQESFMLQQDPQDLPVVLMRSALKKKATVFRSVRQEPEDYTLQVNGRWEFIYGKHPLCQYKVSDCNNSLVEQCCFL